MLSAKKNHKDDDEEFTWIQKIVGIDKLVKQEREYYGNLSSRLDSFAKEGRENYDKLAREGRENYGNLS